MSTFINSSCILFFLLLLFSLVKSILTPSSKLANAVRKLKWGQEVLFLPLKWLRLSCPSTHVPVPLHYILLWVLLPKKGKRVTLGSHAKQGSGVLWVILSHQRFKNYLRFQERRFCIQSHRQTVLSANSVFANLETFITEKKIICSHGRDLNPAAWTDKAWPCRLVPLWWKSSLFPT